VGEGRGFVEAEAGSRAGGVVVVICVRLDSLEESIHDDEMKVKMRIEARAEAMEEADRAHRGRCRCRGTGLPESGLEGSKQDVQDRGCGPGPVMEEGPEALGHGEHKLAHRHVGNDMVHQVGCGLGHVAS
jgi:hypothetical protein